MHGKILGAAAATMVAGAVLAQYTPWRQPDTSDYSRVPVQRWIDAEAVAMRDDSARVNDLLTQIELRGGYNGETQAREALWLSWALYRRLPAGTRQEAVAEEVARPLKLSTLPLFEKKVRIGSNGWRGTPIAMRGRWAH